MWVDSPKTNWNAYTMGAGVNIPIASNPTDNRISTTHVANPGVTTRFTIISPNPGETWEDFKARVWSKKYQYGTYISDNGYGSVANLGDFTNNGWRNGEVKYSTLLGNLQDWANREVGNTFNQAQANAFARIMGNTGALNGGIYYLRHDLSATYPNYANPLTVKCTWDLEFNNPQDNGKLVNSRSIATGVVTSVSYPVTVTNGSSVIQLTDKDTSELKSNVQLSLHRKIGSEWLKVSDVTTDTGGQARVNQLSSGIYQWRMNTTPTGYQSTITYEKGDSSTVINDSGEITHSTNTSSSYVKLKIEKIKHQTVNFLVKDTTNKIIIGEIFSIKKNGLNIGTYPSNENGRFVISRMPVGNYSISSINNSRQGARNFVVEEGKTTDLSVEAIFNVIPSIEVTNNSKTINLGNLINGQEKQLDLDYIVKYKTDNGYTVTAQNSSTNLDLLVNDKLITNQVVIDNLVASSSEITRAYKPKLKVKTKSSTSKGLKNINITLRFTPKL